MGEMLNFICVCKKRFPFDWKTPCGYLAAFLSQCAGAVAITCAYMHFLNIAIGAVCLFVYIAEDITNDLAAFNTDINTPKPNRADFCNVVQTYLNAKQ